MKKIFHFVKSNNLSGLENVIINICTLVKGYNYTYVSTKGPIEKYLKTYGINHITIPKVTPRSIFKIIKKYKPNIVQAHDPRVSVLLAPSYFYCKTHDIRMISELHNDDPKMREFWRLRSILYAMVSIIYNNIICVSKDVENHYAYNKLIKSKSSIIYNIANPIKINNDLLKSPIKKWDCAFLGRMEYQKNPLKFIKIIYGLKIINPNIRAIMMGSGSLLTEIIKDTKKYNLNNNIYFTGFVSNPYKFLQESKLLIVTSRFEGLSMVTLESALIGTPVVATNLSVLNRLLRESGVFENTNYEFVHVINKLLKNHYKYNFIKNRQMAVISRFNNVSKFINRYKKIYK